MRVCLESEVISKTHSLMCDSCLKSNHFKEFIVKCRLPTEYCKLLQEQTPPPHINILFRLQKSQSYKHCIIRTQEEHPVLANKTYCIKQHKSKQFAPLSKPYFANAFQRTVFFHMHGVPRGSRRFLESICTD